MIFKLTDLCKIQYGFAFDSKKFTEDSNYIPLVRIRDVKRGYSNTFYSGDYSKEYVISTGDLLIGMDGEFNIARWKGNSALLNQRVCKIIPKEDVNDEFIRYSLIKKLKTIEEKTAFVTVKHLSAKELNHIVINLPTVEDQNRISKHLNVLETVIDKKQTQLAMLDNLIKSRFIELFENSKYPVIRLGEVCSKITDGTHKTPTYLESGITFISAKNIVNGKLDFSNIKYISEQEYDEIQKRCQTEMGDILLSKSGSLGAPVIVKTTRKLGLFESLAVIKYDRDRLLPEFLCEQLKTDRIQRQFKVGTKGVAIKHLHLGVISDTGIIVPPIDEQKQFATFVEQIDKSKFVLDNNVNFIRKFSLYNFYNNN